MTNARTLFLVAIAFAALSMFSTGDAQARRAKGKAQESAANLIPNSYAVVIGIEQYRDVPAVDHAANDARLVYESLTRQMGYPPENVKLLTNKTATRGDIQKAVETWLVNQLDKDSRVFIYYAGHGAPNPKGESFIVPYDGDPAYLETTGYPLAKLKETLSGFPTENVIVALDSCFSGLGGRSVLAKGARPLMITEENPLKEQSKAVIFSATQSNQISTAYHDVEHGLFTYFFLKGIQGDADADADGSVNVGELFDYIKPKVSEQARRQNVVQVPDLTAQRNSGADKMKMQIITNVGAAPKLDLEGGEEVTKPRKEEPHLPPPGF